MATVLWAAGFVWNAALVFVLLYKRRYRVVPVFTAWIASDCLYTIVLFFAYRFGSKHLYTVLYWSTSFLDVVLQTAVVLEIAAIVLRRSGQWIEGARIRLVVMGTMGILLALVMTWLMKPAADTRLDAWAARGSLFTTVLVFLLFVGVVLASSQLRDAGKLWSCNLDRCWLFDGRPPCLLAHVRAFRAACECADCSVSAGINLLDHRLLAARKGTYSYEF